MRFFDNLLLGLTLVLFTLPGMRLFAQTNVNMPLNSGPVSYTLDAAGNCFINFFDNGGPAGVYSSGSGASSVVTFLPSAPGNKVVVTFTSFTTEGGVDGLFVYDGTTTAAPQISSGLPALIGFPNPFSLGSGAFSGATAPFNITANVVRATAGNISGALTFAFDSDGSLNNAGWTAIVSEVPGSVCALNAPADVTVNATGNTCTADVSVAAPVFAPGGCQSGLQLQYRINGGAATAVPFPAPPTIMLNDMPLGKNQVIWELVNACGGGLASQDLQNIQVNDVTPPSIVCPADMTLTLGPGECSVPVNYNITCTDNCTFAPVGTVTHPADFDNGAAGVMFDVTNLSGQPLVISELGPVLDPGVWGIEVYYTTAGGSWQGKENNPGAWTKAGSQLVVSFGANTGVPIQGFNITLAPGETRGIYITSVSGTPVRLTGTGPGVLREFNDGVLHVSSAPGAGKSHPFGNTFVSRAYNGYVKYAVAVGVPQQLSGLASGQEFPVGTTTNIFRCTDQSGNSATCAFTITVQPFANPISTLICNDLVNVALGPDCELYINADQILEGGPYRCYDLYLVQIDKIPPFNNGPWVPGYVTSADIGKTYGVKVTDPVTGNFCLSNINISDNVMPALLCNTVDLPCNFNTAPTYKDNITLTQSYTPAAGLPVSVSDYQTAEILIPVSGPADAVIHDVDFRTMVTGDPFSSNLVIELESPGGDVVTLWNQFNGCAGALSVRFDDEGSANTNCIDYTSGTRTRAPFNATALGIFDGKPMNGIWKVRMRDINGMGDFSTMTAAELFINFSGTFTAGFPNGLNFPAQISQIGPASFSVPAPLLDACSNVTLSYSDQSTAQNCGTGLTALITRTWTARDASGNVATCNQTLRMLRPDFDDIVFPPNYDNLDQQAFGCGSPYPTPNWIESQGLQGAPYAFGIPFGCSINWTYEDIMIGICEGSYTINRIWSLVDFCTSQTASFSQIIRVQDTQGPSFTCPANVTASTDLYQCCGTVNLPDVVVEDACSKIHSLRATVVVFDQYSGDTVQVRNFNGSLGSFPGNNPADPDTLAVFGNTSCLPLGVHDVYYVIEDGCGNMSTCSFTLTIRDYTAPVAVCDEVTVVSIGADDPYDCYEPSGDGCTFGGVTMVDARTFDDGSYDNCGFIKLTVRRAAPYSDCILSLNQVNGAVPCNDGFPDALSEYGKATGEADSIKFYCCEVGSTVDVILRAYQLDALGNFALGADGTPLYNECMIKAQVQEKLKPGCQGPENVTVSCENFDPSLWAYGVPQVEDNCCLDSSKVYMGTKGVEHSVNYNLFDTTCNKGTIIRTFRVFDCHGQTSQCTQRVVVEYNQNYFVRFPDDVIVTFCDSSGVYGAPQFFGKDCEQIGVSYTDEVFTLVPDACYKIERHWRIINWCTYDPNAGCIEVPNPNPNSIGNHPSNLPGPTVSAPGTAAPWNPTVVKIRPTDPASTNFSTFWNANANCYSYKQIIKIVDTHAPEFENCPASPVEFCDVSDNDMNLWNEQYWYDNIHDTHDLCEGEANLSIEVSDGCSGADVTVRYLLFLDLDGDGTMETAVNSDATQTPNQIHYFNATNPNFGGGQPRAFDQRPVPANQKYRFALQTAVQGDKKQAFVRWNTQSQPASYTIPQLPYGTHKIKWIVQDGCGNERVCEYNFTIKDCKAPTVVCLNGLSTNTMPANAQLMLSVFDFLQYAVDNCTPANQLKIGIRRQGAGTGFPVNNQGQPQETVQFDCADLGPQIVEVWAIDKAGNTDFCETYILIQDNADNCNPNQKVSVAGALATELSEGVESAHVEMEGTNPAGPPVSMFNMTDAGGQYMFSNAIPKFGNYTVVPSKDDNPLNGVTTFDLVLISRHILGLQLLDSPYKMIAADANKSGTITSFDIVELRKLILGIYQELPNNNSWRFVDATYQFPNINNPFAQAFPESKSVAAIQANHMDDNFVGVKIGDVNATAIPNQLTLPDDRSEEVLYFDAGDDHFVKAGNTGTLTLRPADKNLGYQFTLDLAGIEITEISGLPGDSYAIFADAFTCSVDGPAANTPVTIHYRAVQSGRLSEMMGLSGRITPAEAYFEGGMPGDVALRFGEETVVGLNLALYANEPNPFADRTTAVFYLPETSEATLVVYDDLGRMLLTHTAVYPRGYHRVPLDLTASGASGALYLSLTTADRTLTRPILRIRR